MRIGRHFWYIFHFSLCFNHEYNPCQTFDLPHLLETLSGIVQAYVFPVDFWQVVLNSKPSHLTSQVDPAGPFGLNVTLWKYVWKINWLSNLLKLTLTVTPLIVFVLVLRLLLVTSSEQVTWQLATLHLSIKVLLHVPEEVPKTNWFL